MVARVDSAHLFFPSPCPEARGCSYDELRRGHSSLPRWHGRLRSFWNWCFNASALQLFPVWSICSRASVDVQPVTIIGVHDRTHLIHDVLLSHLENRSHLPLPHNFHAICCAVRCDYYGVDTGPIVPGFRPTPGNKVPDVIAEISCRSPVTTLHMTTPSSAPTKSFCPVITYMPLSATAVGTRHVVLTSYTAVPSA